MQPQRDIASPQRPAARAERVDVYGTARGPLARLAGADARLLLPARAPFAAAGSALAAAGAAPPLLAPGCCAGVGADLAAAPLRARAAVRPRAPGALRPAHQELGVRASSAWSGRL